MQYDRPIKISAAGNRRAAHWPVQTLWWSEFVQRVATAVRGQETLMEYLRLPKGQQDDLKDVGGFVGGELAGGRRKGHAVVGRDLITLDLDAIPAMGADDVLKRLASQGCAYAVYSTRKHEPARPRLRVLFPVSRTLLPDEYEPAARKMAELVGIEWCDPTTFQAVRMMYWPSCCADGQHIFHAEDKPLLDADGLLALYADWRDTAQWPQVPGAQKHTQRLLAKQGDPLAKGGVVGAFCRTYNVYQVLEQFLPGVYESVDTGEDRYTFVGGSTTGGAVVYDQGKFLYSHHATDPCGGQLVNAFDLARLHLHGALDEDVKEGTPINRMPSYTAMRQQAVDIPAVKQLLLEERRAGLQSDFGDLQADTDWMQHLQVNRDGGILKLRENAALMLQHDEGLAGRIGFDEFAHRITVLAPLPWDRDWKGRRPWQDSDDQRLRVYLEKKYGFDSPGKILDAFTEATQNRAFNDVQDYLEGLVWDGVPRLDTLLIDYLNAEDTDYTRAVTRKILVAAIARAMEPGVKFDYSLILVGKQGKGKSTLLRILGRNWFLEDLPPNLEGKEASERIQGFWLAEMGELNGLTRSEVNVTKAFLSRTVDVYRQPYGKHTAEFPRQCIIFGSTNDREFLRDSTGNRRFWPVTLLDAPGRLSVFDDLPGVVDQVWAEAKARWMLGEKLFLQAELEARAEGKQEQYRVENSKKGVIEEFLERPLPLNWEDRDLNQRKLYWSGEFGRSAETPTEERRIVCAVEIWCECFNMDKSRLRQTDTREINSLLMELGWEPMGPRKTKVYGSQRMCGAPER